jgi:hypothetical protein
MGHDTVPGHTLPIMASLVPAIPNLWSAAPFTSGSLAQGR